MIQTVVVKLIFKAIMKKINEKHNLKKIDEYVNQDNELDIKVKGLFEKRAEDLMQINSMNKTLNRYGKIIEELEKENAILKKDSHTPVKNIEKRIKWLEKQARKK